MQTMTFSGPDEIKRNLFGLNTIGSLGVQATKFRTDPSEFEVFSSPNLFLALFNQPRRATYRIGGKRYARTEYAAGDMVLVPQSADWVVDFDTAAESTCIFLPTGAISEVCQETSMDPAEFLTPLSEATFRSPLVEALVRRIHQEAEGGAPHGPLYADGLISALVYELAALARPDGRTESANGPTINSIQRGIIEAYVDVHIAERIKAADLADLLKMSTAEFAKAFKNAYGTTPYQFIITRRVEHARRLIETSNLSLAQIAYKTGFASQAHMTGVFSSKVGVSPGKIRGGLWH